MTRRIPAISMHLKTTGSHDPVSASVQQSHDIEQEKPATKHSPRTRNKPAKLKGPPLTSRGRGKGRGRSHDDK